MKHNLILDTDSYKQSHAQQYPPNTTKVYSYLESRGGEFDKTVFFGLQYILKQYLSIPISMKDIVEAEKVCKLHGVPFNKEGWLYILNVHGGRLPLRIKAVKEGSVVSVKNVLMTIENTDDKCFWLTNFMETLLLRIWYPITVASLSYNCRQIIKKYMELTCDNLDKLPFMLHDFGSRGVSSSESAGIGGLAHLVNFMGSDTMEAIRYAEYYYNEENPSFSIPATEHSTMTSWGRENESKAYKNVLDTYKGQMISVVSDSYDIFNACSNIWGGELKQDVLTHGNYLVVRPDCYSDDTEILTNKGWKLFKNLDETELVAEFHGGYVRFVKPLAYVKQYYKGDMINFKSDQNKLDLVVTPNHRMVKYDRKKDSYDIQEAENISYHSIYNLPTCGKKEGSVRKLTAYDKLMIAFQADGYCKIDENRNYGSAGGYYILDFQFTKQRKIDKLLEICGQGGFKHRVSDPRPREFSKHSGKWNDQTTITVYLKNRPPKTFREWVNLEDKNYMWCRDFIDEAKHWDATIRSEHRIKYDSTIESNVDILRDIAVLAGYRATKSKSTDNRSEKFSDVHTLHICKNRTYIGGQSIRKSRIQYDGYIYCVTVPSGVLVVKRKDTVVVSGNSGNPVTTPIKCIELLGEKFGYSMNSKGFKVLNNVRVIQGDGISITEVEQILELMYEKRLSADNICFGMGGGLLQKVNRDTMKFAIKCSAIKINGEWRGVSKSPIGHSMKKSKSGLMLLTQHEDKYITIQCKDEIEYNLNKSLHGDLLDVVFENGIIKREQDLRDIRNLCNS